MEAFHDINDRCQEWFEVTYKNVILYPDEVTASEVGWREGRHEQLF